MTGSTVSALSELELRPKYEQSRAELERTRQQIVDIKLRLRSEINQLSEVELRRKLAARKNLSVDYPVLVQKVRQLKPQYIAMQQRHQELCQLICQSVGKHTLNSWRREIRGGEPSRRRVFVIKSSAFKLIHNQSLESSTI